MAWRHDPAVITRTVAALWAQTVPPGQVIVVDNEPSAPVATALDAGETGAHTLRPRRNLGYTAACNAAAAVAHGEWLLFLNPDADPAPDLLERLLEAADDGTAIVGAQVLLPDGERVNAGDNPVHVCGMAWSGRYLQPPETGPPREVAAVSGAALLVRRADFEAVGRYAEGSFMYYDDVDLAWRARLAGRRVVFCPAATVRHEYDFTKGAYKWFWLERNRVWAVLANYSATSLALLAPLLAAAEFAVLALAVRDGWWRAKLRSWAALWAARAELRRWRTAVQARRHATDAQLLEAMTGEFDTPLLRAPGMRAVNVASETWRRAAITFLRATGR